MSDNVQIAIIAVIGVMVPVIGGIATLFINRWFKKMDEKLDKYHKEVNGKMGELLDTTKKLGNAEGRAEQTQENKE